MAGDHDAVGTEAGHGLLDRGENGSSGLGLLVAESGVDEDTERCAGEEFGVQVGEGNVDVGCDGQCLTGIGSLVTDDDGSLSSAETSWVQLARVPADVPVLDGTAVTTGCDTYEAGGGTLAVGTAGPWDGSVGEAVGGASEVDHRRE